jgi:cytochrome P450
MIKYLRRDLLSIWPQSAFKRKFITLKILNRAIFVANCPEAVEHVLVTHQGNYDRKSSLMRKPLIPLLADGLLVSDGESWRQRRTIVAPAFNHERIADFSAALINAIQTWQTRWAKLKPGDTVPVLAEMKQLSAAILCRTLFGDSVTDPQTAQWAKAFDDYQSLIEDLDLNSFFGLPSWIPGFGANKTTKAAKVIHDLIDNMIAAGGLQAASASVLGQFLAIQKTQPHFSNPHIRHELATLFMAGYESTATTLAWAWYLISQCPEVEQRLHSEVDAVLASHGAGFADYPKLTYTRAIIEETLRLYPPMPMLAREVRADDTIRDKPIPAGSVMLIVPWLLHRHSEYWDKPDHFIPERFLADAPVKPNPFVYLPFSVGARECLAKQFATVQMTLCLALLAKQFRLQWPAGQAPTHECRLTLRPHKDLVMLISPR